MIRVSKCTFSLNRSASQRLLQQAKISQSLFDRHLLHRGQVAASIFPWMT